MSKKHQLDQKQEEIRLRGLRVLARMIVLAHLDSQGGGGGTGDDCRGDGPPASAGDIPKDIPRKDGENVR